MDSNHLLDLRLLASYDRSMNVGHGLLLWNKEEKTARENVSLILNAYLRPLQGLA